MRSFIGFCCILFLFSCQEKQGETPVLSDEKLARIMADLNIAEAATIGLSGYSKDSLMKVYYGQVFEIHGATPEIYEKDLRIISEDLTRLQKIVTASTKLLEGQKDPAKTGKDSLGLKK